MTKKSTSSNKDQSILGNVSPAIVLCVRERQTDKVEQLISTYLLICFNVFPISVS